MRAAFVSFGTRGDLEPLIPLAREWRRRGHDAFVAANDEIVPLARDHDVAARPLGVRVRELLASEAGARLLRAGSASASLKALAAIVLGRLPEVGRRLAGVLRDADVIVVNERYFLLAQAVGERLGVSVVQMCFQPKGATGEYRYPYYGSWAFRLMPARTTHRLLERALAARLLPAVNALRRDTLALAPLSVDEALERKQATPMVQGYSARVCPPPRDWPAHNVVTGYWHLGRGDDPVPAPLASFLDTDVPKVYVGFGSMLYGAAGLRDVLVDVARGLGVRIVWSLGWAAGGGVAEGALSPGVHVVRDVGHDALFPRVDCVVHHGGAGTTGTALRHGRPQVVSWFMLDQEFWASRVAALSAGVDAGSAHRLSSRGIASAIGSVLGNAEYRQSAESIGAALRDEDGPGVACRAIEGFAAGGR